MKAVAKVMTLISMYVGAAFIEKIVIDQYDSKQSFESEYLIDFYESMPTRRNIQAAKIFCKDQASFLWYTSKICGEYHSDSPGCPPPNIDISYVGLKPLLLPDFVANADREHILGRPLVRISSDSRICRVF